MTEQDGGPDRARRSALKITLLGAALLPACWRQPVRGQTVGAGPGETPVRPPHDPALLKAEVERAGGGRFRPERFGARGDGRTNDTDAFGAMGLAVEAAGGGVIELAPGATYVVGRQRFLAGAPTRGDIVAEVTSYLPARILWLRHLPRGLTILGNGATLKAADGLRYGTFDPRTGRPNSHPMPYVGSDIAYPYDAMVGLHDVTGPVVIERLTLDGNCDRYVWGGRRGDTGWQLPGSGFLIEQCPTVVLDGVESRRHGLDGLQCEAGGTFTVMRSRFHHNCRLNGNLRAGSGLLCIDCSFDFAAKGERFSAPAGGFDLEAEIPGEPIRSPRFVNCRFRHNRYQGMAADTGDTAGAVFENCVFWSGAHEESNPIYLSRPGFTFRRCTFGGPLIVLGGRGLPRFDRCLFTDDPSQGSLDGTVNLGASNINVSGGGLMFSRSSFALSRTRLPGVADPRVTFDACRLATGAGIYQVISGTYRNCRITGRGIDLGNSSTVRFGGVTTVNGERMKATGA